VNLLKPRFGYDDSLDVFGVHGIGGTWGALATGLFATTSVNPAGRDGLFYGNPGQLWIQFVAVAAGWSLAIVGTAVILGVIKLVTSLRVTDEEEVTGLDVSLHGEAAYNILGSGVGTEGFRMH
jgi:Amt family ammonium transporter